MSKKSQRKRSMMNDRERASVEKAGAKSGTNTLIFLVIGIVVIIGLAAILMTPDQGRPSTYTSTPSNYQKQDDVGSDVIAIPLSDLSTEATFYTYEASDGTVIKYFAVETSDGEPRVAFDACDVCHEAKKGYYQDGEYMVCRNCGNRYLTNQIGTANKGGGCWPGYLESSIADNELVIQVSDLEAGGWYF